MTKKIEPTETYLLQLEGDLAASKDRFEVAKRSLYRETATAKLGEPAFETARKVCLETIRDIEKIENEIFRVRRGLGK